MRRADNPVPFVLKSRSFNLLERSGPVQACYNHEKYLGIVDVKYLSEEQLVI